MLCPPFSPTTPRSPLCSPIPFLITSVSTNNKKERKNRRAKGHARKKMSGYLQDDIIMMMAKMRRAKKLQLRFFHEKYCMTIYGTRTMVFFLFSYLLPTVQYSLLQPASCQDRIACYYIHLVWERGGKEKVGGYSLEPIWSFLLFISSFARGPYDLSSPLSLNPFSFLFFLHRKQKTQPAFYGLLLSLPLFD